MASVMEVSNWPLKNISEDTSKCLSYDPQPSRVTKRRYEDQTMTKQTPNMKQIKAPTHEQRRNATRKGGVGGVCVCVCLGAGRG